MGNPVQGILIGLGFSLLFWGGLYLWYDYHQETKWEPKEEPDEPRFPLEYQCENECIQLDEPGHENCEIGKPCKVDPLFLSDDRFKLPNTYND